MLEKFSRKVVVLLLFVVFGLLFVNCVPPPATKTSSSAKTAEAEKKDYDKSQCMRYLSFAQGYYQNQDWKSVIRNYKKMIEIGCEEDFAEQIYPYLGRAYRELRTEGDQYLDSAAFVYQRGLEYTPSNVSIRKNLAYIYKLQGETNLEIRENEKLSERDPENIQYYKDLCKLYFKVERYEDVVWAAGQILEIEPNNEQAINDRMLAYQKLGKNVIEVQKEAWEKNPTEKTGVDYSIALENEQNYAAAIEVLKQLSVTNPGSYDIWNRLALNYKNLNDYQNVIKTYTHIATKISVRDLDVVAEIVNAELKLGNFTNAYTWAKKAKTLNAQSQISLKIIGDVYYEAAENQVSSRDMNFEDKLVYKLAYDYYTKASAKGEFSVKSRIDYLKEYRIPSSEDWFMNKYDSSGNDRTSFKPALDCYNWIEEAASK